MRDLNRFGRMTRPIYYYLVAGMIIGCGSAASPENDRNTLANFLKVPAQSPVKAATEAATRLVKLPAEQLNSNTRLLLATFFDLQNQPTEALAQLAIVKEADPLAAQARLGEGRLHLGKTRLAARAEESLKTALACDPKNIPALVEISNLYDIQGRIDERNQIYLKIDELSALGRDSLLLWTSSRRPDAVERERSQIIRLFHKADATDRHSALALVNQLKRQGDLDEAEAVVKRYLPPQRTAGSTTAFQILNAEIELDRGEVQKSLSILNQIKPDDLNTLALTLSYKKTLGRIQFQLKDYDKAENSLKKALAIDANDRESLQLYIQLERLQKRASEAAPFEARLAKIDRLEDLAQKAMASLHRDDAAWLEQVANTAGDLGRYDVARAWLRQILSKEPLNQKIQEAIFRLNEQLKSGKP